jgi:hypothetical protein
MSNNRKTPEAIFASLPKSARQRAYELVRTKVGREVRISVPMMLQAHKFLVEM